MLNICNFTDSCVRKHIFVYKLLKPQRQIVNSFIHSQTVFINNGIISVHESVFHCVYCLLSLRSFILCPCPLICVFYHHTSTHTPSPPYKVYPLPNPVFVLFSFFCRSKRSSVPTTECIFELPHFTVQATRAQTLLLQGICQSWSHSVASGTPLTLSESLLNEVYKGPGKHLDIDVDLSCCFVHNNLFSSAMH